MSQYVGVKFQEHGQIYFFLSNPFVLAPDEYVIVSTEEGLGLARVAVVRDELPEGIAAEDLKPIQRVATEEDFQIVRENEAMGKDAFAFCQQQIQKLELDMKLVDVEVRYDQSKIVFFFTAPARIDFRELVKVLVSKYRTRIELRQIGVRHEAQILGGIGGCGRVCCCHQFMRKFEPVTIKMAKEQQLFLNPSKISGACGRLLCCLNFEKKNYADFQKRCPKIGKKYTTSIGEVKVLRANMFRDSLVIGDPEGEEREISLVEWAELRQLKRDDGSREESAEAQAASAEQGVQQRTDPDSKSDRSSSKGQASGQAGSDRTETESGQQDKPPRKRSNKRRGRRRSQSDNPNRGSRKKSNRSKKK
jgi:cell fate regulator YaaT (PSP1 superfamily)